MERMVDEKFRPRRIGSLAGHDQDSRSGCPCTDDVSGLPLVPWEKPEEPPPPSGDLFLEKRLSNGMQ